jgi:hypothetical protein
MDWIWQTALVVIAICFIAFIAYLFVNAIKAHRSSDALASTPYKKAGGASKGVGMTHAQKELLLMGFLLLVVTGIVALTILIDPFFAGALTLVLLLGLLLQGLAKLPANPPTFGLITFFGEPILRLKAPGWRFFLFRGFVFDYIPFRVDALDINFPPQPIYVPTRRTVRGKTQGFSKLLLSIGMTAWPAYQINGVYRPDLLLKFLFSGRWTGKFDPKEDRDTAQTIDANTRGVLGILFSITRARQREWAVSDQEGPQDYADAMSAQAEVAITLLKAILGEHFDKATDERLVSIIYRRLYRSKPLSKDMQKTWEQLSEERRQEIEKCVHDRHAKMLKLREGGAEYLKEDIGLVIGRLTIEPIEPDGKLAEVIDLPVKEQQEAMAEAIEAETLFKGAAKLHKKTKAPLVECVEMFQVERGKVKKTVEVKKFDVAPDSRKMIERIVGTGVADKLLQSFKSKGGSS